MERQKRGRRPNRERTEATRAALLDAARALFVSHGYAATSTPDIVAGAGLTRGALYHHFADKADLFRAVVEREAALVARLIDQGSTGASSARDALVKGARAFFAAMVEPGRTRLLLIDGPAVLGTATMEEIDRQTSGQTLREGLAAARAEGSLRALPLDAASDLLSAAFDRAALKIAEGLPAADYEAVILALLDGLRPRPGT